MGKLAHNIILVLLLLVSLPHGAFAQTTYTLWSGPAPKALGNKPTDIPTITAYLPKAKTPTAAVVICPGGGYARLALDHEGAYVSRWFNKLGVAAFVFKYRLPINGYRHPVPLLDAQRALRLVRARAAEWNIDPGRVGIMGFSAGGHVASTLSTHFDAGNPAAADRVERQGCRPDFAILLYPVVTMKELAHKGSRKYLLGPNPDPRLIENLSNETQVTPQTPPTFIAAASDDKTVPVQNSVDYYLALVKAKVPAELHLYETGGHGFGMRPTNKTVGTRTWQDRLADWIKARGIEAAK